MHNHVRLGYHFHRRIRKYGLLKVTVATRNYTMQNYKYRWILGVRSRSPRSLDKPCIPRLHVDARAGVGVLIFLNPGVEVQPKRGLHIRRTCFHNRRT